MNQPPSNFDFDESTNGNDFQLPQAETDNDRDDLGISPESLIARKQQLKRLLIILVGIGVSVGLILSVGVVILLNKLGLTKKPHELEQQQPQSIEQIYYQREY